MVDIDVWLCGSPLSLPWVAEHLFLRVLIFLILCSLTDGAHPILQDGHTDTGLAYQRSSLSWPC